MKFGLIQDKSGKDDIFGERKEYLRKKAGDLMVAGPCFTCFRLAAYSLIPMLTPALRSGIEAFPVRIQGPSRKILSYM